MVWPPPILQFFDSVPETTTDESRYYGPYNALLSHLFPMEHFFQIAPQYKGPVAPGSVDFTALYVVKKDEHPIFFIEINPYPHLLEKGTRAAADSQMRDRFLRLSDSLSIPTLYGVSAMGTRFSVYEYTKETGELTPPAIPRDNRRVNDQAPQERWAYNLMDEAGETKFRQIVMFAKQLCK